MTMEQFYNLKIGERVWDTYTGKEMRVTKVNPPSDLTEGSVSFEYCSTMTIFDHGCESILKLEE